MLYSLLKFMGEPPTYQFGGTYLDSVIRILPNAVHTTYFSTDRPQDLIVSVAPSWFQDNGFNIGAYALTEGFLNFGAIGAALIPFAYLLFFQYLDKTAASRPDRRYRSAIAGSFAYLAAFYGSTNLFKSLAFSLFILLVFSALDRMLARNRV